WGYYDVSGQYDKEFECNNSESGYLYCCGTCYYRFCCKKRHEKLDQRQCTNYQSPVWVQTPSTKVVSPGPENKYDPEKDKTNFTVYITCGVIAFVIVAGVFAKVSYDKAHRPPREMNIHRQHASAFCTLFSIFPGRHALVELSGDAETNQVYGFQLFQILEPSSILWLRV
uniref:Protein shisa-6 n=1 Tax=Camelus bactrianus TaxID=9837 RepID=A0A9W3GKU8_CAMBA